LLLGFDDNRVQYRERSNRALLHHSVEDKMQFTVVMYSLLHRSIAVIFQLQDILGTQQRQSPMKAIVKKKRQRQSVDSQYTVSTCAPLIHRFTEGGRVL
jgi:hypothetical protein